MNGSNGAANAAGIRTSSVSRAERARAALDAGAKIAKVLWDTRSAGAEDRAAEAVKWARAGAAIAGDREDASPIERVAAVATAPASEGTVEGLIARAERDVRFVLAQLDPTNRRGGYEPRPEDVFEVMLELERRLDVAATCSRAERDAAILAMHAVAHGRAPWVGHAPDSFERRATIFGTVGKALGFDPFAIEDAEALARNLGRGDGSELSAEDAEAFLRFGARFRVRPDGAHVPSAARRPDEATELDRMARAPSLLAVLEAHRGRWAPEAVQAAESFAARLEDDRPGAWWVVQLDRFDDAARSARQETAARPDDEDKDEPTGGGSVPPSSASPASPAAPPAAPPAPPASPTMAPPTLASPRWRGSPPARRVRRGAPHLRLVVSRSESPCVALVAGGAR